VVAVFCRGPVGVGRGVTAREGQGCKFHHQMRSLIALAMRALLLLGPAAAQETGSEVTLARRELTQFALGDVLLLSTLDGSLQARLRDTGAVLWTLESAPLVDIVELPAFGPDHPDPDGRARNGRVQWLAEPSPDGGLYFFTPESGIEKIPASVQDLVQKAPFGMVGNIVYTGARNTTLYALDVRTGEILQAFGSPFDPANREAGERARADPLSVIMIGRTEYTLDMHEQLGAPGWRVRIAVWTPNSRDHDLAAQYTAPLDSVYVTPLSPTTVMALAENDMRPQRWVSEVPDLLVDVFDVLESPTDRSLALVAQPPLKLAGPDQSTSFDLFVAQAPPDGAAETGSQDGGSACVVRGERYSALLGAMPRAEYCDRPESVGEPVRSILGVHPAWCQEKRRSPARSPAMSLLPSGGNTPYPRLDPPHEEQAAAGSHGWLAVLLALALAAGAGAMFLFRGRQEEPKRRKRGTRGGKKKNAGSGATTPPSGGKNDKIPDGVVAVEAAKGLSAHAERVAGAAGGATGGVGTFGPITVSDVVLGHGSHGTAVYKGRFENRDVAVKRMLLDFYDVASQEVDILRESDDHPNVVRYFCKYQTPEFLYIALELCPGTLEELVRGTHQFSILFDPLDALQQIARGLQHLHNLQIVHRDIKPQNILVALPNVRARGKRGSARGQARGGSAPLSVPSMGVRYLISDFGLCRRLDGEQSSFLPTAADSVAGTAGWAAPEVSATARSRLTRAVDVFSMGCLFYYVLSGGKHPFGELHMRQANIQQRRPPVLESGGLLSAEACDLIPQMLNFDPAARPTVNEVLSHPLFWSDQRKLDFLVRVSDRLEHESREEHSDLIARLEQAAPAVVGADWHEAFPPIFVENLGKYRRYHGDRILDLLRALRNKLHHYNDFSPELKACVGSVPQGYLAFFTERFPSLLVAVYYYAKREFAGEDAFKDFF